MLKLFAVSTACLCAVLSRQFDVKSDEGVKIFSHSFDSPLDEDELANWRSSGASVGTQESYVIVPSVPGRNGTFWHLEPLETEDFLVNFRLKAEAKKTNKAANNEYGFWYTAEQKIPSTGDLAGQDRTFDGFGFVFEGNEKVSLYLSDGSSPVSQPSATAKLDWLNRGEIDFAVRVSPTRGIHLSSRQSGSSGRFKTILKSQTNAAHSAVQKAQNASKSGRLFPEKGFISFSGRAASSPDEEEAALIMIRELEIKNFDLQKTSNNVGDAQVADALKKIQNLSTKGGKKEEKKNSKPSNQKGTVDVIDSDAAAAEKKTDKKAATPSRTAPPPPPSSPVKVVEEDADPALSVEEEDLIISSITDMLNKHAHSIESRVKDQTRLVRRVVQDVRDMRLTVKILKAQLASVKASNNQLVFGGSDSETAAIIADLKKQVATLQAQAVERSQEYEITLDALQGDVKHTRENLEKAHKMEIAQMRVKNAKIRESIEGQGIFTKVVLGVAMGAIALFAYLAYRKMQNIEKRHIL